MAKLIGIVGPSGKGKTASLRNMSVEDTVIFNVVGKPLSFLSKFKNVVGKVGAGMCISFPTPKTASGDILKVTGIIDSKIPAIKNVIIDDFQYLMAEEFMDRAYEKGYNKFVEIATKAWQILKTARFYRDDLNLIITSHSEVQDGVTKMKTVGKMLDTAVTLEGYFVYVFFVNVNDLEEDISKRYVFETQSINGTTAKSPMGCFPTRIPNDLNLALLRIAEFERGVPLEESEYKDLLFSVDSLL
jgi:hypothetical protein